MGFWMGGGRRRCAPEVARRGRTSRHREIERRHLERLERRALLTSDAFEVMSDLGSGFGGRIAMTDTQSVAVSKPLGSRR
jgi:hypothetical protein